MSGCSSLPKYEFLRVPGRHPNASPIGEVVPEFGESDGFEWWCTTVLLVGMKRFVRTRGDSWFWWESMPQLPWTVWLQVPQHLVERRIIDFGVVPRIHGYLPYKFNVIEVCP